MNLYFIICGALAILIGFGVFENILKLNNLNRWVLFIFFILNCIFDIIGEVEIFNVNISLNLILYGIFFIYYFLTLKSLKAYLATFLTALLTISIFASYNAINLSEYEFDFFQPIIIVACLMGAIFNFTCPNIKSVFCGALLGSVSFELIFHKIQELLQYDRLKLGGNEVITFTIICLVSYCFVKSLIFFIKQIKLKQQEKVKN